MLGRLFKWLLRQPKTEADYIPEKIPPKDQPPKTPKKKKAETLVIGAPGPGFHAVKMCNGRITLYSKWYYPSRPDKVPEPLNDIKVREMIYSRWLKEKKASEKIQKEKQANR